MGMEPFDYLTYKRNKTLSKTAQIKPKDKKIIGIICAVTFVTIFILAMIFIASKSSKIDIEYGRLGQASNDTVQVEVENNTEPEEDENLHKFTIDKRLFLIQQEEKGPSESRVVKKRDQAEVISQEEFNNLKTNSEEVIKTAEKQLAQNPPADKPQAEQNKKTEETAANSQTAQPDQNKVVMKPKLPVKPTVTPLGALETTQITSKVLIGKYYSLEDARKMKDSITGLPEGVTPFVRKVSTYYAVQIGSYDSFDYARAIASRLKAQGYDVWILQ